MVGRDEWLQFLHNKPITLDSEAKLDSLSTALLKFADSYIHLRKVFCLLLGFLFKVVFHLFFSLEKKL